MSEIPSDLMRIGLTGVLVNVHVYWTKLVNTIVPDPYLDEVFHIPQAQQYWAGNFTEWDPKITTPPGLYLFSTFFNGAWKPFTKSAEQTTNELRGVNFWLIYGILIALYALSAVAVRQPTGNEILTKELVMITFPLLVFFSSLYYTDVLSTFAVLMTYLCWAKGMSTFGSHYKWQLLQFLFGMVAVGTRQTNIVWVCLFLGGLQVRDTASRLSGKYRVFDPPMLGGYVEDFLTMSVSVLFTAINHIPRLVMDLWPQIATLASFAGFVYWNEGVVLGDKTHHIATLNGPQLLYLFPFIIFFSWPAVLPHMFKPRILLAKFPRLVVFIPATALALVAIHYNTTSHPFTLADNRHYPFYVLRLLLSSNIITRYLAAPIYIVCATLIIIVLMGTEPPGDEFKAIPSGTVRVSFVATWLLSSTVSLVTTPLLEPRYFIIPWLLWRLHVPSPSTPTAEPAPDAASAHKPLDVETAKRKAATLAKEQSGEALPPWLKPIVEFVAAHVLWVELAWLLAINVATGYVFLYKGFEWPQEPGKVQRFMW